MRASIFTLLAVTIAALPMQSRALSVLSSTTLDPENAEIIDYSPVSNTLASTISSVATGGFGVRIYTVNADGTLTERTTITFDDVFGTVPDMFSASSTALDPKGRGFGAVALIPTANGTTQGKVGFFDFKSTTAPAARKLKVLDVGFHPDSIKFSPDGTKLIVANEGERTTGGATDAPGSISIIDLTGITTPAQIAAATFTQARVTTFDFQPANLGSGVVLTGLRYNDEFPMNPANYFRAIEPEYVAPMNDKVYVTLQENNAIAEFTYATAKWTRITPLGTITQTIDASDDEDSVTSGSQKLVSIDESVAGLPMPDGIAAYEVGGQRYLVTVNEGDARPDDADINRVTSTLTLGSGKVGMVMDAAVHSAVSPFNRLGRLNISLVDGDTDNDNDIDVPTMLGTRSFTIWNADTGALVWDSGSLETLLNTLAPAFHNINNGLLSDWDTRSDDKGPEPEALAIGTYGSSVLAFVGLERQNGLLIYNITDPTSPVFLGYQNNLDRGIISPESVAFIPAAGSPNAMPMFVAGYEGTGTGGNGIVVHDLYTRNDVLVYKLATARNWNQDEVYNPASTSPITRNPRAGVMKDNAYFIVDRTTRAVKTISYYSRVFDGAPIKEYKVENDTFAPWAFSLPAGGEMEFLETLAPGTGMATASFKQGETLVAQNDIDFDGDSVLDRGTSSSLFYLIGNGKDAVFGKKPNTVTLPKVATKLTGVARQVLAAELGDTDGAGPAGPVRQVFFRSSGAQTATLDTVLTTKVLTVVPAANTGLILGDMNYATSAVIEALDKLGYDAADPLAIP